MSFWIMREYSGCKYLKLAFKNIQLHDLDIDLTKSWGHTAGTVKVNLMLKLTEIYNSAVTRSKHKEIVQSLDLMIKECDEHLGEILTSKSHTESFDHHNDEFMFFDATKKKMIKIEQKDRKPLIESFATLKIFRTELMVLIDSGKETEALELVSNTDDCLIDFDFYGTAFGFACEQGMVQVANKILDKYGSKCFKKGDNYELEKAISYGLNDIALKLLKDYNCTPTVEMLEIAIKSNNRTLCVVLMDNLKDHELKLSGKSSILASAMYENIFDLALILIDKFGEKCCPAQLSPYNLNTPLIEACKRKYENIAIKLIETFGLDICNAYHVNKYNETALSIAKINGLNIFIKKFEELTDKAKLETLKLEKEKLEKELVEREKLIPPVTLTDMIHLKEFQLNNKSDTTNPSKLYEYYNTQQIEPNTDSKNSDIYIYYKGTIINDLESASTHYLKLVKSNSPDATDFKRVVRLFTQ